MKRKIKHAAARFRAACATGTAAFLMLANNTTAYASGISQSKLATGTEKLIADATTWLMVLAPVVEETLFRGYVFGNLREVHRGLAYLVSCLLFALLHVWQFAAARGDLTYLLLMVQYLVPGAVMAWTYERSGSLWGSVLLHGVVNGLAVVRVL